MELLVCAPIRGWCMNASTQSDASSDFQISSAALKNDSRDPNGRRSIIAETQRDEPQHSVNKSVASVLGNLSKSANLILTA